MMIPYSPQPLDAFIVAESSLAAVMTAALWARPLRPWPASVLLGVAIWICALLPIEADVLATGFSIPTTPAFTMTVLRASAGLATLALVIARPRWPAIIAAIGQAALWWLCDFIKESDQELSGVHLMWLGFLIGVVTRFTEPLHAPEHAPPPPRSYAKHDLVLFLGAVALALVVAKVVLELSMTSDDEWAYTYQADLLGHAKAYAAQPPCGQAFRAHWVFWYEGRGFAQYTPGWPFFMAPFARLGVPWLAAPIAQGLLAVGVARLARRARAGHKKGFAPPPERDVRMAGILAAALATLGAATLLNGASRFPHTFVAALFAWAVEALCAMSTPPTTPRQQWGWGAVLGLSAALLLATRPPDGGTLGVGLFLYFVYALVRRRLSIRIVVATVLPFAIVSGLTLVVLRLQLGEWFKSGYNIAQQFYSWAEVKFSVPAPNAFKYGLPFVTAAYMYFPCSAALGAAGLVMLRGRALRILFMLLCGAVAELVLVVMLEFGRGTDFGYGPRYHLVLIVPFAVGGGVFLAPLLHTALSKAGRATSALRAAGPATVAVLALLSGTVRLFPLVYPAAHAEMHSMNGIFRAVAELKLKNAFVSVTHGASGLNPLDVTRNDPTDPSPDVFYIGELDRADTMCLKELYPDRYFYRANGKPDATITPDE